VGTEFRKRLAHGVLLVALGVVPVVALNSFATAESARGDARAVSPAPGATVHGGSWTSPLTEAQRRCLADERGIDRVDGGSTAPGAGSVDAGSADAAIAARRFALHDAAVACGLPTAPRTRERAFV
jgi:hypothetical protein